LEDSRIGEGLPGLDVYAFRRLLQSDLPIALYPCATQDGAFALGPNNTYWQMPNLAFIGQMHPQLRRYLDFAFGKSLRHDFLRAMEVDGPADTTARAAYAKPHHVWETALWMSVAERQLVRRADGRYHLIPRSKSVTGGPSVGQSAQALPTASTGRRTFRIRVHCQTCEGASLRPGRLCLQRAGIA
jgi:hypothetical protein